MFMQKQLGFERQSILISLGEMIYSTNSGSFWQDAAEVRDEVSTLVFLHGFGGGSSSYEWSKVYPAFADEYRILAPDLIGWGRSAHPVRNFLIEDYLATIAEFLEKTCNGPAAVIASSLTAAFTIRVAIARPELFKSLILVAPAGLSDFGRNDAKSLFTQLVSMPILDRLLYLTAVANEVAIRLFLEQQQFAQPHRVYSEMVDAYLESAQQPNAEHSALSFVRGDLSFDLSQYVERLRTPTAILWGKCSKFTGPDIGHRLAEMNPEAVQFFQLLDDVGLTPQLEVPEITIGLIYRYLRLLKPLN
jgi:pimeloyl-ACP methyl ester carboxylesterase